MWVLRLGLNPYLKVSTTFKYVIFEKSMHVSIPFKVDSSFKFIIHVVIFISTN